MTGEFGYVVLAVCNDLGKGTTTIQSLPWIRSTSETDPGRYQENYPRVYRTRFYVRARIHARDRIITVGSRTWNLPHTYTQQCELNSTLRIIYATYITAAVLVRCRLLRAVHFFRLVGDAWRVSFARPLSQNALKLVLYSLLV